MVADGTYAAVLDRVEVTQSDEDLAVLLLESGGETVDDVLVERDDLPGPGRRPDAVFAVTIEDGDVAHIEYLPGETRDRRERAQTRFDRLSRRPPDDDSDER